MQTPGSPRRNRSAQAAQAACPGLINLVQAVDGGLCRIRLAGGRMTAAQARALAVAARKHGAGPLEITNRANLQLRGIRAEAGPGLIQALIDAGLGPLPASDVVDPVALSRRDARRNVMISPLAGIDPLMRIDTSALAADLLQAMQQDAALDGLSPKFAVLLDGGERLVDRRHPHDIWLGIDQRDLPQPPGLWLGLASAPAVPLHCPGYIAPQDAVTTVLALMRAFMELATTDQLRMRDVLADQGLQPLLSRARRHGARLKLATPPAGALPGATGVEPPLDPARLGQQPQAGGDLCLVGFQAPLARLDADMLEGLAELSSQLGRGELRFTPWQGGLLPHIRAVDGPAALTGLRQLGLITDAADPLARLLACAGRRGCARTQADTKADALRLARAELPATGIHLSGCPRSCAAASPAGHTLLAVDGNHYDLYRRGSGRDFGECLGRHLTLETATGIMRSPAAE